jgi:hypothetical protein
MILRRLVIALGVFAAIVAGCGDSDDSGSTSSTDESVDSTTDSDDGGDGGESSSVGAAVDLGDFPIPVPPGVEVSPPIETIGVTAVNISFAVDDFDSVVAFYDDFTTSGSDEYQRVVADAGGVIYTLVSGEPGEIQSILVSSPVPGDDTTFATLTAGTQT